MPINSTHPEYKQYIDRWQKCRDTYAGEEAVKAKNDTYLPMLSSMKSVKDEKYLSYKARAMFYSATSRTVEGLVGMAMRKPYKAEFPSQYEHLEEDFNNGGMTLENFIKLLLSEVCLTARAGLLVDYAAIDKRPYTALYPAENITNWEYNEAGKLSLVVLREYEETKDPDDKYVTIVTEMYRELYLEGGDGFFNVSEWREDPNKKGMFVEKKLEQPGIREQGMPDIPFVFVNSKATDVTIQKPPLLDMINVNLSHYRTSADLEHGRHFTALPTPYIFGIETKDEEGNSQPIMIGSETCIVSEDPAGSAGYMEFTGQGLAALERAMTEKADYMVILGATLLQSQKKAAETAETARLNKSGDSSTMVSIITAVESGIQQAIDLMLMYESATENAVTIEMNTDLLDSTIDPQTLTALLASWQAGGISHETYLYNVKQGELMADDVSVEDELGRIDDEIPNAEGEALNLDEETPEEKRKNLKIVKNETDGSYDVTEKVS